MELDSSLVCLFSQMLILHQLLLLYEYIAY